MTNLKFKTTDELKVPSKIIDQIIGQESAVNLIKKASAQRRNVLLIGDPGTGKSMLAQGLAELIPEEKLQDVLSYPNPEDDNTPLIRTMSKGKGKEIVDKLKIQAKASSQSQNIFFFILLIIAIISPWLVRRQYGDIMAAASLIGSMIFLAAFILFMNLGKRMNLGSKFMIPKLLIDNSKKNKAPFIDATGSKAGALLGDVLHDPLQSGGLGTPAYERLIPGMIHKANGGVLFIDEIAILPIEAQQELLTAMQEKRYPIKGQSERSSGSTTISEPAPTDFILVAAGNLEIVKKMHPALRSRIRGYGYEVYMNVEMDDNQENRNKIALFVSQEVSKDKKIPPFTKSAVQEIINEAKRRSNSAGKLSLRLRELGGLIRAAGDLAKDQGLKEVNKKQILEAKKLARTLEQQIADRYIENKKKYNIIITKGHQIGRVNGLAVLGDRTAFSGIVLPIESEVTIGGKKADFVATGKLGVIAKEAVKNVSAIILKFFGEDIKEKHDIYIQFLQTGAEGGVEGDSASISVATAIISAFKNIPVRQDTAMTGSLSIRGEVLAVGGVTAKVEAAIEAGIKRVIIPKANLQDLTLSKEDEKKIKIIPAAKIQDVLKEALIWKRHSSIWKKLNK